jgi:hypothetical protein
VNAGPTREDLGRALHEELDRIRARNAELREAEEATLYPDTKRIGALSREIETLQAFVRGVEARLG